MNRSAPARRQQHWAVHGRRANRRGRHRMIAVLLSGLVLCFATGLLLSCVAG